MFVTVSTSYFLPLRSGSVSKVWKQGISHLVTQLIIEDAVCRTVLAVPGMLNRFVSLHHGWLIIDKVFICTRFKYYIFTLINFKKIVANNF